MMNKNIIKRLVMAAGVILSVQTISAQKEIFNPVYTGVTSLSIAPDSRAGAMGDVGCATDPYMDNNNQYWNPSKYPFTNSQAGVSLCYTPWLRKLVSDIDLANLTGFYKLDDYSALSASLTYFSLGEVIAINGSSQVIIRPYEMAIDFDYSRKLSENFSAAVGMRFIYSDLQYNYDDDPDDISPGNVFRQSISLIAKMPLIAVYSYNSYLHFRRDETLFIRSPDEGLSLAENLLLMLRPDGGYTELEAKVLDIALILHAEHGGGNNSSFTTHVVSSSGTDTYSAVAASIGSLKGFRHGGANIKVQNMFDDLKANISDWKDEDQIREYLVNILNKKAFDRSGLIYGIGHAVYTYSDPREVHLKRYAKLLAEEKGCLDEFE